MAANYVPKITGCLGCWAKCYVCMHVYNILCWHPNTSHFFYISCDNFIKKYEPITVCLDLTKIISVLVFEMYSSLVYTYWFVDSSAITGSWKSSSSALLGVYAHEGVGFFFIYIGVFLYVWCNTTDRTCVLSLEYLVDVNSLSAMVDCSMSAIWEWLDVIFPDGKPFYILQSYTGLMHAVT